MAKKCRYCGAISKETATVCKKCKKPLLSEETPPPSLNVRKKSVMQRSKAMFIDVAHSFRCKEFLISAIAAVVGIILLILLLGGFGK